MDTDLAALLAVQVEDVAIHGVEAKLAELEPRIRDLDTRRQKSLDAVERAAAGVAAELLG